MPDFLRNQVAIFVVVPGTIHTQPTKCQKNSTLLSVPEGPVVALLAAVALVTAVVRTVVGALVVPTKKPLTTL
jgi:hypothetical protein